jgi:glucuronate isomerase
MLVSPSFRETAVKPVAMQKAKESMVVTEDGIVMLRRAEQPKKADSPMLASPSFRVTAVKPVAKQKAQWWIDFTEDGIVMLRNVVQRQKA